VGCINPLKHYEYLAAGLPVVSSRWPTVESINSPAMLVDSVQSFVQAIEDVIAWPKDELAQRQTSAQDFARAHSWEQTVEKLLRVVFDTHE
jgi:glycosyltransferase involved in cell wall biosynthesis